MVAKAFKSNRHPISAHLIVSRRCNLSCSYCNEFDGYSSPVALSELCRRVDQLADLGTTIITFSGGEPLLHPELDQVIKKTRQRRVIATLLTNGTLLTPERIKRLNSAGLDQLQISVDQVRPDSNSRKCLQVLDRKLEDLARYAAFDVSINSVVGGPLAHCRDALTIAERAVSLGFSSTVGLIHNGNGQGIALLPEQREIQEAILKLGKPFYSSARYDRFQQNLSLGLPNEWHCRAGSRYLYVCEDGLVHHCSQQKGKLAIPLDKYGHADFEREYHSQKSCAPHCTISCVHKVAVLDEFRENPRQALLQLSGAYGDGESMANLPGPVRLLTWLFLTGRGQRLFRKVATRILRAKE
jgi:MoaA/NifB/PqqE/SkfB family radical SAM enzyme